MYLRNIFLPIIIIIFFSINLYSQRPNREQFLNFNEGSIKGRIISIEDKKGLPRASASLFKLNDSSLVTGAMTDVEGNLTLTKLNSGRYFLRINYVGFEPLFIENIVITPMKPEYNFGVIELSPISELTDEVLVTAEKDIIQFKSGKRIINVDQDIASRGGSAIDILKNAPSVNVDIDGNISLRGSGNVNILINGKPSTFLGGGSSALEQLPASLIDHIEIITNPSAKYEAEGATGILNIVLKEERDPGLNGLINLNAGSYDRYSGNINLNYKVSDFNLNASYGYNTFRGGMDGSTNRITSNNDTSIILNQSTSRRRNFNMHNLRLGIEYNIDKFQSLILSSSFRSRIGGFSGNTNTIQKYNDLGIVIDSTIRKSYEDSNNPNYDLSLNYKNNFTKESYLSFDIFYSKSNDDEITDYNQVFFILNPNNVIEKSNNYDNDWSLVIQSDYINKFLDIFKLESGIRFSSKVRDNKFSYERFLNNNWVLDTNRINNFIYDENIFAAYTILSIDLNPLYLNFGLRGENSNIVGDNTYLGKSNRSNYFDLFPSANISYKFSQFFEIQGNYSRRITRPSGWALNPFVDYTDIYTIRYGNPYLEPEYSNLFELGTIHNLYGISISPSLFYRKTENVIERYQELLPNGVIGSTSKNMAESESIGLELNLNGAIFRWFRINGDLSYYNYKITGIEKRSGSRDDYTWSTRISLNMFLSKQLNIQLSSFYSAPSVTAQGTRSENLSFDAGIRYDIIDNLTLTFRASDIFDTQKFSSFSQGPGFTFNFNMKRMSQSISLGLQYKINQGIKQRERTPREENNQPMDDF